MKDEFTLAGYRAILETFLQRGYEVQGFDEADPNKRHLIVRHDVDMSTQLAVPMAELEHRMRIVATYFVMVRTELYNPFSSDGQRDLRRLVELGHRIGLHFDPSVYPLDRASIDRGVEDECTVLGTIIGRSVNVVSLHRPSKSLQGKLVCSSPGPLGGRRHADEALYFQGMGFRADSRGAWHYGHPLDHPAVAEGRALMLLTHPIWWVSPGADPAAKLRAFLEQRYRFLDESLGANCLAHKPRSGG